MPHPTEDRNFRLPPHVRPSRYQATLTVDLAGRRFTGEQTVTLSLSASADELVLHALELTVESAELRAGGKKWVPSEIRPEKASETVVLRFDEAVPAGEAELELRWKGPFCEGLRGLYAAGALAVTQFEAADARRVFPCFDEPAFKARWAITARIPQGVTALSNGRVESDEPDGELRRVRFAETELLSSYLIALVVGELASSPEERAEEVLVRTWARPDKVHLTRFGQDVALAVLPRLRAYFGLPYAFGKLDQVGVPDFEAGAMENAGLITYREIALLLDPKSAPLSVQKRVAEVVTHELAHQWFGNWVTMVWWDDLWLNEAFATWMAYKIVDDWRPDWRVWLDFDSGKAQALHLDSLASTHPIRADVHNAGEATENFDLITYEKGGAVLRMIEAFLGEAAFREGIRDYMKRHARANATADDLWSALARASQQPVLELANAWIRQSGHPVVGVELEGNRVTLTQERFYSQPGAHSQERWPVPVVIRFADATGQVSEHRAMLGEARAQVSLPTGGEPSWLCANAASAGFYRVSYAPALLERLADNLPALAPSERISLLSDQWALVRAGRGEVGPLLDLAGKFGGEGEYAVLDEAVGRLGYLERRLPEGAEQEAFRRFVAELWEGQLRELGWDPKPDEGDDPRLRRAALVRALGGVARAEPWVSEAKARARRVLSGEASALEANLLDPGFGIAARAGDPELFETLRGRFKDEKDPATQRRYLMALTAFEAPDLVARAQALFFDGVIPLQDSAGYVTGLLANPRGRDGFWRQLRERWGEALDRTGRAPMLVRRVVEALGQLPERRHLDEVRAHLKANPVPEAQQAVAQTLERLEQDVALRERLLPQLSAWLAKRG